MNDEPDIRAGMSGVAPVDDGAQSDDARTLLGPLQDLEAPETLHLAVAAMSSERAAQRTDGLAARVRRGLVDSHGRESGQSRRVLATSDGRTRARVRRRWIAAGVLGAAAIAAVAALAIGLGTGRHAGPGALQADVSRAARFGLAPATMTAPGTSPTDTATLNRSAAGIPFPNWKPSLGWQASGARSDRLDGRTVATVFYEPAAAGPGAASTGAQTGPGEGYGRVGYAIVEGKALPTPGGPAVTSNGTEFHVLSVDKATVLTWRRAGHTCILVAKDVPSKALMRLAVWQ